uniref:Uncharacterized protein n=1 Tax=Arundo donax TaxID=35708 RepID=A0A0A9A020_ARUDO
MKFLLGGWMRKKELSVCCKQKENTSSFLSMVLEE